MGTTTAQPSPTNAPRQLSDGNSLGTLLGISSTDLVGFYGATPVPQPTSPAEAQLGPQPGATIFTWSTTQSPSAVANITTGESTMTVQSGTVTATPNLIATTDLIYVNKPTAQAGLGMGNVRASAANQIAVTFSNATGATITPTASEVYKVVSLRGIPPVSATLSPVAVAPNTTAEQQFTVTAPTNGFGLSLGQLVQVSKPTSQAGLDIVGCRVVSSNVVGITFANVTAATITPTASEAYTIWALPGLDAFSNLMGFQMNAGTIGAIGAGLVITGGATTFTGALATDIPVGPPAQPTAQAAATNAASPAFSIISANTMTMYFLGIGTGATPTAALSYNQVVYRQNPAAPLVVYTQALTPVSVAANTAAEQTFTVTGLISGTPVWVNKPSATTGLGIAGVRVSATNTLAINYINTTAAAIIPPVEAYVIGNFQVPAPGAGNCVYQTTGMVDIANADDSTSIRGALVSMGIIKGS
jgi:hypothetical protein